MESAIWLGPTPRTPTYNANGNPPKRAPDAGFVNASPFVARVSVDLKRQLSLSRDA